MEKIKQVSREKQKERTLPETDNLKHLFQFFLGLVAFLFLSSMKSSYILKITPHLPRTHMLVEAS